MRWKAVLLAVAAVGVSVSLLLGAVGLPAVSGQDGHPRRAGDDTWRIPSILSGLMSTPNEVAEDLTHHGTPSPVVDSLLGGRPILPTANGQVVEDCNKTVSRMTIQFEEAVRKHTLGLATEQPDVWSGPSPLCGVNKLYNLTRLVLHLVNSSSASVTIRVQHTATFVVQLCNYVSPAAHVKEEGCPDIYLAARLVGSTIVNAIVSRRSNCDFQIDVKPFDAGKYRLEVQVVWLNSLGPEKAQPSSPVTLRKIHSKYGRKPHQKYAFNAACEEQTHVPGSPLEVEVVEASSSNTVVAQGSAMCSSGTFPLGGRWVANANDKECGADHPYCVGRPYLLNDAKPFNEDFLWAPIGCRYRFWGRGDGPGHQCVRRRGTMLLMGDSTTREYAQSLRLFDLSKTGLAVSYANWKLEWQFFSRRMAEESLQRLGQELKKTRPVVLVANLGPLHLIGGLKTSEWKFYVDQWAAMLQSNDLDFVERKIFLGPAAIHYATNDMTAPRMLMWMKYAQEKLEPLGFELLDGWSVTQSRPESTWDGVHYAAERGKAQMKHIRRKRPVFKWNGGVSIMLATILLNMLCGSNSSISSA